MSGSMSEADLLADLQRSLHDAASVFSAPLDADWKRFLAAALAAMSSKRPRTLLGSVTLVADQDLYPLPAPVLADFLSYKTHLWGGRPGKPWMPGYAGALPRVSVHSNNLVFDPAPSAAHLAAHGSAFRFWYFCQHRVGATAEDCTINPVDRSLLILRAQVEAMRELAMRNVNKPVQVRDGFSGTPRNATPAALSAQLLDEWKAAP